MREIKGDLHRTVVCCIDSFENESPKGRLYTPRSPSGESFHSLIEFLWSTEQYLNKINFPQAYSAIRSFQKDSEEGKGAEKAQSDIREGLLGTFKIRILFRQNASWQGCVEWIEGETAESFRSVLELIFLIKSAIKSKTGKESIA